MSIQISLTDNEAKWLLGLMRANVGIPSEERNILEISRKIKMQLAIQARMG